MNIKELLYFYSSFNIHKNDLLLLNLTWWPDSGERFVFDEKSITEFLSLKFDSYYLVTSMSMADTKKSVWESTISKLTYLYR